MNELSQQELKIRCLESIADQLEQVDCPVTHSFAPGIYIREINMRGDTYAIGHNHKTEHLNILVKGSLSLQNEDGSYLYLEAPYMYIAKPGRKIALVHTDTIWLNLHPNVEAEQDITKLEDKFLDKTEAWVNSVERISPQKIAAKAIDTKQKVVAFAKLPLGSYKIIVRPEGVFATGMIRSGEVIAEATIKGVETYAFHLINQSGKPNAEVIEKEDGDKLLIAIFDIKGCRGGFDGEEITLKQDKNL